MRAIDNELFLSATDLSNFLGCRHRMALDMAAAIGKRKRPYRDDPLLALLVQRGLDHEAAYVARLASAGLNVVSLAAVEDPSALVDRTISAMRAGADVIVQAGLRSGRWFGKPDILMRTGSASSLGDWSYEVEDTKLSSETRAGTILQLGLYSEMLADAQGCPPQCFRVVTPDPDAPVQSYRVEHYAAYFRLVRNRMLEAVALGDDALAAANYPDPVEHCDICCWSGDCLTRRRHDDHLSLVAGIARLQRRELVSRDVHTLTTLAGLPLPLEFKPKRGSSEGYTRVREQARLQLESRGRIPPLHELRQFKDGDGLCRLPEPSPGDVFLDLEGDVFTADGGREYLFGLVTVDAAGAPIYRGFWAFTDQDERTAFEAVIDIIVAAAKIHPGMHVYHYAPYEPSAFKRLMGRYATRERELDSLLRGRRFVDLYGVVRQSLLAGVERYSIKNLEPFYAFDRSVDLSDASRSLRTMEQALQMPCPSLVPQDIRDSVEGYNRDDCISTLYLRGWLEGLRTQLEQSGTPVPRPAPGDGEASEAVDERAQRVAALREQLLAGIPDDAAERDAEQQARWLLAYMLDWHRREAKAAWHDYFKLREMAEEDLLDEDGAVSGLEFVELVTLVTNKKTGNPTGSVVDRYRYPAQEFEIRAGHELKLQTGARFGEAVAVDRDAGTIDIRKGKAYVGVHPSSLFAHSHVATDVLEQAIDRLAVRVIDCGAHAPSDTGNGVAMELLLKHGPRVRSGVFAQDEGEAATAFASRVASNLDETTLAIQGPPGSGKTYTGARMICALVAQGKRVGVTGPSHKAIRGLLEAIATAARERHQAVGIGQKLGADEGDDSTVIGALRSNEAALEAVQSDRIQVLGGTAWLWARPEFANCVDVLFVDEAGQMALANTLAVSGAADSLVLLGDPQQLDQPQKGSHPTGVNASALEHILDGEQTISSTRGIFLPVTWRLAPAICAFTSEMFYENRLLAKAGLEQQVLAGVPGLEGNGLWVVDVEHDGNRNSSDEEVDAVAHLVARLTTAESSWTDGDGAVKKITSADILVVAPYNAHVARLASRLGPAGPRVGTVDKFQGQEAPVVIYSMATSSADDAPRGMEFLYSLNRLNVATSRARCAAILVANRRLFEPECRAPRQMKLANAMCRYREMAHPMT